MKSILLNSREVRGILSGNVRLLLRPLKKQPYPSRTNPPHFSDTEPGDLFVCPDIFPTTDKPGFVLTLCESKGTYHYMGQKAFTEKFCPWGGEGAEVCGKETFFATEYPNKPLLPGAIVTLSGWAHVSYRADSDKWMREASAWKPAQTMKQEYSRLHLRLLSVRVVRLNDVSEEEAIAAGIERFPIRYHHAPGFVWGVDRETAYADNATGGLRAVWGKEYPTLPFEKTWIWMLGIKRIEAK